MDSANFFVWQALMGKYGFKNIWSTRKHKPNITFPAVLKKQLISSYHHPKTIDLTEFWNVFGKRLSFFQKFIESNSLSSSHDFYSSNTYRSLRIYLVLNNHFRPPTIDSTFLDLWGIFQSFMFYLKQLHQLHRLFKKKMIRCFAALSWSSTL